jgi:hypothetical protein
MKNLWNTATVYRRKMMISSRPDLNPLMAKNNFLLQPETEKSVIQPTANQLRYMNSPYYDACCHESHPFSLLELGLF